MSELIWRDDPDAESVLRLCGVSWVVREITLSEIDWNESANNCARMQNPLNDEKIEDYATSMKAGDVFPMIVVEHRKSGYVVLGGNQRCNALKRIGVEQAKSYVVKTLTTAESELIIRSLNSRHGWGTSKEDRIEHAVYMVRKFGIAVDDAARLFVVGTTSIQRRIRIDETKSMLARKGVETASLCGTHIDAINKIADEDLQVQVAEIASQSKVNSSELDAFAKAINNCKGRAQKIAKVREFAKELAASVRSEKPTGKVIKKPRRVKFFSLLESLVQFLERGNDGTGFSNLDELQCSAEVDGDKLRVMTTKIVLRLQEITK